MSNSEVCFDNMGGRLSYEAKNHEAVRHALSVRSAVTSGNYVLFFRLYKSAPNLNTCLMGMLFVLFPLLSTVHFKSLTSIDLYAYSNDRSVCGKNAL